jgi:preprotein translocase subunit SecE
MNRAVRRQQLKDKPDEDKPNKSARTGMPKMGPAPRTAKGAPAARQKGAARFTPRFAADIVSELKKVVWPKREDVVNLTIVIVICTVLIGTMLGLIDIGFSQLIDKTLL